MNNHSHKLRVHTWFPGEKTKLQYLEYKISYIYEFLQKKFDTIILRRNLLFHVCDKLGERTYTVMLVI